MVSLEQKIESLAMMFLLKNQDVWFAKEWYEQADLACTLALAFQQNMIDLTSDGVEVIDAGYQLAHTALEMTEEDFYNMLLVEEEE